MALSDYYAFYSWAFVVLVAATGLYVYRQHWFPVLSYVLPAHAYERINPPSFEDDLEAGLSSDTFSLSGNIADGDSRAGLDTEAKNEIRGIMKKKRVNFDQARRLYLEQKMAKNGIGADGRPLDPRAVFFS